MSNFGYFQDNHVGQNGQYQVEEITNDYWQHYFKASYTPTHIFGTEVDAAPLVAYGKTQEIALERLEIEISKFNECLWH